MKFTMAGPRGLGIEALADREERLKRLRDQVPDLTPLRFNATVFVEGPNKNHVQLNPSELEEFAASFIGQPFMRDHEESIQARAGTIVESKLTERDGKRTIWQTIEAVKPWAIESVLDGTISRFSIGWDANQYICLACDKDFGDCPHMPWDLGHKDKESGRLIEVLMKEIEGAEVSAVTRPAVAGTGIEAQLKQLKVASGMSPVGLTQEGEMEKVLARLGLAKAATETEALAAIDALKTSCSHASLNGVLGLPADAPLDSATAKVVQMTAPGSFVPKEDHDKVVKELCQLKANAAVAAATKAGKVGTSDATQAWALKLALEHPQAFDSLVKSAPPGSVIPLASVVAPPPASSNAPVGDELTEEEEHVIRKTGTSKETYLRVRKEEQKGRG